jgi:Cysteine rich repeat
MQYMQRSAILCNAAKSCKRDIKRRCKDVKGDGHGELVACLRCTRHHHLQNVFAP